MHLKNYKKMKKILGLDLGTNSIGWALIEQDFEQKKGKIDDLGVRIIPMTQDVMGKFDSGQSISQTAERTGYRGVRRLNQRKLLRRERLHRVLNIMDFLPRHYKEKIDFIDKKGQFQEEVKIDYKKNDKGKYDFIFKDSYNQMLEDFRNSGYTGEIPYDWTLYYLRKKALTQPISKEELAWILLNFNQKRGYYQLRDEMAENDNDKKKEFVVLKVKELKPTGEKTKDGKELYEIIFENDWVYPKQTVTPEAWERKTKEYIVTTSTMKDGSTKRTFKQVDSEKDWIAIKEKTQQDIENSSKEVGEYIYEHLLKTPKSKIKGGLIKTIERKFYKEELKKILDAQKKFHPALQNQELYSEALMELYPYNEGHRNNIKNKDLPYLILEDIIFYQRPLKSQKSLIGNCPYEKITYVKKVKDPETNQVKEVKETKNLKVISKSNPVYEEFRLWPFLHNLKIYKNKDYRNGELVTDVDVTHEVLAEEKDWEQLFEYLSNKKEMSQKTIIDFLVKQKKLDRREKDNYHWNYPEDKKYPAMPTRAGFLSRLKKVNNLEPEQFLTPEIEKQLWHIIYSVQDPVEYEKALKKFADKHGIDQESFVKAFIKHPPFKSEYGALSEKAIKKLLPLMRLGKFWKEEDIHPEVKQNIDNILERLKSVLDRINRIEWKKNEDKEKKINEILEQISDDDIPRAVLKSFLKNIDKNPYKGLQLHQASYAVYGRHSEATDVQKWESPADITRYLQNFKQHSLRNPIVEQVILETLKVVRDIWETYGNGEKDFFDEIHLELGRELKNPANVRKQISQKNAENERTNARIRALLKELLNEGANPESPSHQEILKIYEQDVVNSLEKLPDDIQKIRKENSPSPSQIERYKLWLDQKYVSPYTGKIIPLSKLFSTDYQIEHIIPQSRYFDNSLNNKVIAESEVNQDKGNKTAKEYILEKGGYTIDGGHKILNLSEYQSHVEKYFSHNKKKMKNLLTEDIPDNFINRQLNDSRYISKVIKSLLSNIVREENEQAETSKNLIAVTGQITSMLKHNWGLSDKWNKIILPRFKRLNELTQRTDFTYINRNNIEVPKIPEDLPGKINKKRIDHRHHALDALVIAAVNRNHIQYINALNNEKTKHALQPQLLIKNEYGHYTRNYQLPWEGFPVEAAKKLETIIPSFKQNLRVINKATNKYWKWVKQENGSYKKQRVPQTKGDHWAIRKPLHKETIYGKFDLVKTPKNKIATFVRTPLSAINKTKHLEQITDRNIREVIIPNHLKKYTDEKGKVKFEEAFSPEGIEDLNKNIVELNNGKAHQPIYKVKMYEVGSRFPLSDNPNSPKHKKYVEAAKGTNLFYAVYWDEKKKKRNFETIPLKDVIAHQKMEAHLPKEERTQIPLNEELGRFLFYISPNDLVYVPDEDENIDLIDFKNLSKEQVNKIYLFKDSSASTANFIPVHSASLIFNMNFQEQRKKDINYKIQNEYGIGSPQSKNQKSLDGKIIKNICWKLKIDRLGNIYGIEKGK